MKGAAWGVPVLATALATPIAAASCLSGQRATLQPSPYTHLPAEGTFTVPTGVRRIKVTVIGGWGGSTDMEGGGSGDLITAYIAVTPGEQLTLIAANGGLGAVREGSDRFRTVLGGGGFGAGGDATPRNFNYGIDPTGSTSYTWASSGGGGSAILRSGTPLVVAGGGGAGGTLIASEWHLTDWSGPSVTGGAGGGANGYGCNGARSASPYVVINAFGGRGGTLTAPGAGGSAGNIAVATRTDGRIGLTGSPYQAGGGDGANAVTANHPAVDHGSLSHFTYSGGAATGAGGGGYTGGGSGSAIAGTGPDDRYCSIAMGAGGGGASYWADGVTILKHAPAGFMNTSTTRKPGSIAISWDCSDQ